jgi:uncharacterized linocin/CFP29 family protein
MGASMRGAASIDSGKSLMKSGGWAAQQFIRAANEGSPNPISPASLRTNEILRDEEWKVFDTEVIEGARERLRLVADLIGAGLVRNIPNGLAKTVLEYDTVGDMDDAIVSLDGVTRSENDRLEYERTGIPLPITHKDWYLNLRSLLASRTGSEPLDTTYARVAGRKVGEKIEDTFFNGGRAFGGLQLYGLLTHPNRNTSGFGTNGNWSQTAKTGANILADIVTGVEALDADGFTGPYWLYIGGTAAALKLNEDFKAATDSTIRSRILELDFISRIVTNADKMPDDNVVLFQPTSDVIQVVQGEPLQTVQWDAHGGFQINFKAFAITVPNVKSDGDGGSGIFHMS